MWGSHGQKVTGVRGCGRVMGHIRVIGLLGGQSGVIGEVMCRGQDVGPGGVTAGSWVTVGRWVLGGGWAPASGMVGCGRAWQ